MNTYDFELAVAHSSQALSLHWIMTTEGLRMQWTSNAAPVNDNILIFPAEQETQTDIAPAVA